MNRLSGSTRSTCIQCITVLPRSLCRNLIEPIPIAISSRALNSLNNPMRIRTRDEDCFAARATIPWYLLDYDQHAPSPVDRGALDPAGLGHAARGHLLSGASADCLDRTTARRELASNCAIGARVRRASCNRLDDWALEWVRHCSRGTGLRCYD